MFSSIPSNVSPSREGTEKLLPLVNLALVSLPLYLCGFFVLVLYPLNILFSFTLHILFFLFRPFCYHSYRRGILGAQ